MFRPVPPELAQTFLSTSAPQDPLSPDDILRAFQETIEPYPFGNGHPRFWGWVNSPPAVMGVFAEALAAAMNPSCAGGNHAAIYVEHQVLNWFREMLGFPAASGGLLVSGGSMATMTALAGVASSSVLITAKVSPIEWRRCTPSSIPRARAPLSPSMVGRTDTAPVPTTKAS